MPRRHNASNGDPAAGGERGMKEHTMPGAPSPLTCPECGGALWEIAEANKLQRYRCHVGHSYTAKGLLVNKGSQLEAALWSALRTLEENAELRRRMARRAKDRAVSVAARHFDSAARESEERADVIRRILLSETQSNGDPSQPAPPGGKARRRKASVRRKSR